MNRSSGLLSALAIVAFLISPRIFAQTINITGTVVDSGTSAGISGATVKLLESPQITATTAANGTFTLTGTATAAVDRASPARQGVDLALEGNKLTVQGSDGMSPVTVDVYTCSGIRMFHATKAVSGNGSLHFEQLWTTPGLYYVKVGINGVEHMVTSFGAAGRAGATIRVAGSEGAALTKSAAGYTVQASASGYATKSVAVSSATGTTGTIKLATYQEQTGVWVNVTPSGMDPSDLAPATNAFGPGSIVADPTHPSNMYVGGSTSGLWKTSDYGKTWAKINSQIPYVPRGTVIGVAGTTPATIWASDYNAIWKSTDGGVTFTQKATNGYSFYSFVVDPYDNTHLLSGLHEADSVLESTDAGATWFTRGSAGWPSGGISWYPYFINTGSAATTRHTWVAIAQNGASFVRTTDGGAHWTIPTGVSGLQHPHGNNQIFQSGATVFVAGTNGPNNSQGVFRSTDYGVTWTHVDSGTKPEAVVWGTAKNVYAMYGWACSDCNLGTNFESAPLPGTTWTNVAVPSALVIGPSSLAVTFDGTHYVFVGEMWAQGLWRYVEP